MGLDRPDWSLFLKSSLCTVGLVCLEDLNVDRVSLCGELPNWEMNKVLTNKGPEKSKYAAPPTHDWHLRQI